MKAIPILLMTASLALAACDTQQHSARCEPACGEYQVCDNGVCRDRTCNPPCRQGRVCVNGFCLRECDPADGAGCVYGETCCAHVRACVDTDTDIFNCGECGHVCPPEQSNVCSNGRCGCRGFSVNPCGEGYGCCDDGCKDLRNDPENCGECGHSCRGLECVEGQCRCSNEDPCAGGEECCADGCRDLSSDPLNCGACGAACDGGEDCCDGECVNTFTDTGHCGQCGHACASGEECCIGACTDTATDPYNCGECLVDCGAGGTCVGGACQ